MKNDHIVLNQISKSYFDPLTNRTTQVLDSIDLSVQRGEFLCIVGPSGCGKTTLLNIIAGHLAATSGTVTTDGKLVTKPQRNCLSIFQEHALFPWRTVAENVSYGLELKGRSTQDCEIIVHEYLALVGLERVKHKRVSQLSGGMKQRVQMARTLVMNPEILLMDEPFGSLDSITAGGLHFELERIWLQEQKTIVFVTHNIESAVGLADRIVLMGTDPGRIVDTIEVASTRPRKQMKTNLGSIVRSAYSKLGALSPKDRQAVIETNVKTTACTFTVGEDC